MDMEPLQEEERSRQFPVSSCIAENHIVITYPLFKEGAKDILDRKYNKIALRTALILLALLAALLLIGRMMNADSRVMWLEIIMYGPLVILLRFYLPGYECKRSWNEITRLTNGEDPVRDVLFYPEGILVKPEVGDVSYFLYGDIVNARTTDRLIILTLAQKAEIMLDRQGFVHGSIDDIRQLIGKPM